MEVSARQRDVCRGPSAHGGYGDNGLHTEERSNGGERSCQIRRDRTPGRRWSRFARHGSREGWNHKPHGSGWLVNSSLLSIHVPAPKGPAPAATLRCSVSPCEIRYLRSLRVLMGLDNIALRR